MFQHGHIPCARRLLGFCATMFDPHPKGFPAPSASPQVNCVQPFVASFPFVGAEPAGHAQHRAAVRELPVPVAWALTGLMIAATFVGSAVPGKARRASQ